MGDIPLLEKIALSIVCNATSAAARHRSHAIDANNTHNAGALAFINHGRAHARRRSRYDADLETLLPGVTERFQVAVGKAFVEDRDQLNAACSLIGVLKVLVVLNIWGLKNTRVQLILAAVAVPGFALVIYAHMALGDMPSAYMPAVVFMILLPKTAFAMLRGDDERRSPPVVEAAPAPAPKNAGADREAQEALILPPAVCIYELAGACRGNAPQQPEARGLAPSSSGRWTTTKWRPSNPAFAFSNPAASTRWLSSKRATRNDSSRATSKPIGVACESARTDASSVDARDIAKASARRVKIATPGSIAPGSKSLLTLIIFPTPTLSSVTPPPAWTSATGSVTKAYCSPATPRVI